MDVSRGSAKSRDRPRPGRPIDYDVVEIVRRKLVSIVVVLCAATVACRDTTGGIRTEFVGSYTFSAAERRTIDRIAGAAALEARRHLPALAPQILLQVRSGKDVSPEIGATAAVAGSEFIRWTVDSDHPHGVATIAETHLRAILFHEFHHLVRGTAVSSMTLMDHVITEGMATAFERDVAGASYPMAQYPDDVAKWVDELLTQSSTASQREWMFRHPDGRRWVGYRAGTYLVDQAMQRLNRTSADLVLTPTAEILAAAGVTAASGAAQSK